MFLLISGLERNCDCQRRSGIDGQHVPLLSPSKAEQVDFLANLKNNIMLPLQQKWMESGFDGLVWQAGEGNPVMPVTLCYNILRKKILAGFGLIWN